MEPPVQEPSAPMHRPPATAAPEPLEDPPVMWPVFHGFRAGGNGVVKSGPPRANSCMASLPRSTAPASRYLATTVQSSAGTLSMSTLEPEVVRTPAVSYRSLWAVGMP